MKKESFMEKYFWDYLNNKKEIKLNFQSIPIIIFCLIIIYPLGKIGAYIMSLKLNLFLNIIVFIVSLISLIYCGLKTKIIMAIFFLIITIILFVNIFHPIIK